MRKQENLKIQLPDCQKTAKQHRHRQTHKEEIAEGKVTKCTQWKVTQLGIASQQRLWVVPLIVAGPVNQDSKCHLCLSCGNSLLVMSLQCWMTEGSKLVLQLQIKGRTPSHQSWVLLSCHHGSVASRRQGKRKPYHQYFSSRRLSGLLVCPLKQTRQCDLTAATLNPRHPTMASAHHPLNNHQGLNPTLPPAPHNATRLPAGLLYWHRIKLWKMELQALPQLKITGLGNWLMTTNQVRCIPKQSHSSQ